MNSLRAAVGFSVVLILVLAVEVTHAFTRNLPAIPTPKPTIGDGLLVAEQHIKTTYDQGAGWTLVGVDWAQRDKSGEFKPRISDGIHWQVEDAEWSWFLTYVKPGHHPAVMIVRIHQNGKASVLPGIGI